jgi:FKBP-type peptidyl-prolyl cis-trans isomerase FkpA
MFKRIYITAFSCLSGLYLFAQQPAPAYNFKKLNPNLEYSFILNKSTSPLPKDGDQISVNMQMICNNRQLFNSLQTFKGKPAVYGVTKPAFNGDVIAAIVLMTPGDSIVCRVDAETLFKNTKNKKPDFIKSGDKIYYFIKLLSVKTKEQMQKEQQDAINKQIQEQMAKAKSASEKQVAADDKLLKEYFAKQNINPVKTASGLYYLIKEEGKGIQPVNGDNVAMNYTGTLLDGTKFDSNEDSAFQHVQPYEFPLGKGVVIRGWDEGIALMKEGTKAILFIPSGLAYGGQARPGSAANPKGIPANSVLIFNVQVMSVKHAPIPTVIPKVDSTAGNIAVPKQ